MMVVFMMVVIEMGLVLFLHHERKVLFQIWDQRMHILTI